ncbi:sirohydrochlorin chelatase [Phytomonospora endophytica]|uniref:Sirohydrochlorin ferrochelatase n=1 Tax=Phytomonospora endophytica TaxID=714109 RepID=A0A841G3B8_9ACTN|nr:sirohydrochlorin ferrochelatase [Phytomonospora endophytica]GIG67554.1 cobalamin biosynthesis protein [Phytomonospora endophytica]
MTAWRGDGPGPPLVLIAHGSRDGRSSAVVRRIAARLDARASFIDFDRPDPVTLLTALADAGHRTVAVVPLLLTDAFHSRVDVPRLVAEVREKRPGLEVPLGPPVGGAALIPALARALGPCDGVVLAAAGTRDTVGQAHVRDMALRLGRHLGVPGVAAYAASAEPGVGEAVTRLHASGARNVAVASYFIAPGLLYERVRAAAVAAGVPVAPPLGDADELLGAVRAAYVAALRRTVAAAA